MGRFSGEAILVTGGAGFVGGNLVRRLVGEEAASVVIADNFLSAERTDVLELPGVTLIEGSVAADEVLDAVAGKVDRIFHLATYHGNQSSIADPLADHANNTLTTLKLFDRFAGDRRVRSVVYASAGCTVAPKGQAVASATQEDAPVSLYMDSPYQISKVIGEMYANYYLARHGLPVVKARFQNVYGPGEILGAGEWRGTPATVWRNVTPTFIYRAIRGLPITLEGGGQASRDFIYVEDIVEGLIRCATEGRAGEVYNLASGRETTIRALAELVVAAAGGGSAIEVIAARDWDRSIARFGSTEKASRDIGFTATVAIEDGIERTVRWTREHIDVIERAIEKHRGRMPDLRSAGLRAMGSGT